MCSFSLALQSALRILVLLVHDVLLRRMMICALTCRVFAACVQYVNKKRMGPDWRLGYVMQFKLLLLLLLLLLLNTHLSCC